MYTVATATCALPGPAAACCAACFFVTPVPGSRRSSSSSPSAAAAAVAPPASLSSSSSSPARPVAPCLRAALVSSASTSSSSFAAALLTASSADRFSAPVGAHSRKSGEPPTMRYPSFWNACRASLSCTKLMSAKAALDGAATASSCPCFANMRESWSMPIPLGMCFTRIVVFDRSRCSDAPLMAARLMPSSPRVLIASLVRYASATAARTAAPDASTETMASLPTPRDDATLETAVALST
mmetsp:Transcript_41612/g.128554  ORF Transcript_41612/g.128554 Transcript_41612/m.128554 type:complete len:241 (-) Transcript_41612:1278-2000(-)